MNAADPFRRTAALALMGIISFQLVLMEMPSPAAAMEGDVSISTLQKYFRSYQMRTGEKLTWEWRVLTENAMLNFDLKVDGNIVNESKSVSDKGTYTADRDRSVNIEWVNYYPFEVMFHFKADRTLDSSRYVPFSVALVLIWSGTFATIMVWVRWKGNRTQ